MIRWETYTTNSAYRCQVGEFTLEVWREPYPHSRFFVNWWLTAETDVQKVLHGKRPVDAHNIDEAQEEGLMVFRDWFLFWAKGILKELPDGGIK